MSLKSLPNDIKYKLLEKCPQLRFVFLELDYPYKINKNRKVEIIEYNGIQLEFRNKNMECISSYIDVTFIECLAFHKFLPFLFVGCSSGFIKIFSLYDDYKINKF